MIVLFALGWLLRRCGAWVEGRRFLAREVDAKPQTLEQVERAIKTDGLRDPSIRQLATVLRARELSNSAELDVPASVLATVRAGGRLVQVERRHRRVPEYLALVERESLHDQQAAFFDGLLDDLRAESVHVERRYFVRDPHLLLDADPERPPMRLSRIQGSTSDFRLLVFSDGANLIDGVTGRLRSATAELDAWPERSLVTPEPPPYWSKREGILAKNGLRIVPSTLGGLAETRLEVGVTGQSATTVSFAPPVPDVIRDRGRAWLHDDAPEPDEIAMLVQQLRAYLGAAGYQWFAACALYPQVRWPLTVGLGHELVTDGAPSFDRDRLQRMARLPWLRAGFIPDWLRTALLRSLTTAELAETRRALYRVLTASLAPGKERLVLQLSNQASGPLREAWRTLLRHFRKNAPSHDPANDRVFLRFLDDGMGLRVPIAWGRRLTDSVRTWAAEPVGPPGRLANLLGTITTTLAITTATVFAFNTVGRGGVIVHMLAVPLRADMIVAQFAAWLLVLLRWASPNYDEYEGLRWRVILDGFLVLAVLAIYQIGGFSSPSMDPRWGPAAVIVSELMFVVLLGLVLLPLSLQFELRSGVIARLAKLMDRFMPDRILFARHPSPAEPSEPSRLACAVIALLSGPSTYGMAVPAVLTGALLQQGARRTPAWTSVQLLLALLPVFIGVVPALSGEFFFMMPLWYGLVPGTGLLFLAVAIAEARWRVRSPESLLPVRRDDARRRATALLSKFAPQRLLQARPLAIPLVAMAGALWLGRNTTVDDRTLEAMQSLTPALVWFGWPEEGIPTQAPAPSRPAIEDERLRSLLRAVHERGKESNALRVLLDEQASLVAQASSPGAQELRELMTTSETRHLSGRRAHAFDAGVPWWLAPRWQKPYEIPDIPLEDDPRVQTRFEYYTDNPVGREQFQQMLSRCGAFKNLVQSLLIRRGLPSALLAVVLTESGCTPSAVSPGGAAGLWQLTSEAASAYGLRIIPDKVDERYSPYKSTDAAVRYLGDLYAKFGSWDLALAAYTMGPLGLLVRMAKVDDDKVGFWDLADADLLPDEPVFYVSNIEAIALILDNREQLKFTEKGAAAAIETAELAVPPSTRLGVIARAAATSLAALQRLNLDLKADVTPAVPNFVVEVPKDVIWQARDTLDELLKSHDDYDLCVPPTFDWGRQRFTTEMAQACHSKPLR